MHEVIIPTRYILTKTDEVGVWAGVAYHRNGKLRSELLWGTNRNLAVQLQGQVHEEFLFTVHHVFVERYIHQCLRLPFETVEIFRFFLSRGELPERPSDMFGETVANFKDRDGKDCWTTYDHVSGPYLADTQYIASSFSAGRLEAISPEINFSLIPDRASYERNPQDLPIVGVLDKWDGDELPQKYYEDLVIRSRSKKRIFIN